MLDKDLPSASPPAQTNAVVTKAAAETAPASVPLIKSDPAESFKKFVAFVAKKTKEKYGSLGEVLEPKYDLRPSDSLLSPVLGTMTLPIKVTRGKEYSVKTHQMELRIESDQWVVISLSCKGQNYTALGLPRPSLEENPIAIEMNLTELKNKPWITDEDMRKWSEEFKNAE